MGAFSYTQSPYIQGKLKKEILTNQQIAAPKIGL